jgi:hypothetical protein
MFLNILSDQRFFFCLVWLYISNNISQNFQTWTSQQNLQHLFFTIQNVSKISDESPSFDLSFRPDLLFLERAFE